MPTNTAIALARPYAEDAELPGRRASAFELVRHLLTLDERVSTPHRREMLGTAVWKWTEAEGVPPYPKYHVRRRTTRALDLSRPASVNHEHVWPRKWILDQLLAKASWSDEELWTFLETYGVPCTVTVEEHARLGVARGTGWARYVDAGVEVWDMLWDQPFVLPGTESPGVAATEADHAAAGETPADVGEESTGPAPEVSPDDAIAEKGGTRAELLRAVVDRFRGDDVVVAVGRTRDPSKPIGDYLRVHDNALEEPSPAVAYLHWNGKLSVRLVEPEVPGYLLSSGAKGVNHHTYGVEYRVVDPTSVDVAEALIELALEKARSL